MFVRTFHIRVRNTDAGGGIYFSEQLQMAQETFECYLEEKGMSVHKIFSLGFGLPVVHVESDFFAPLHIGDKVDVVMTVKSVGRTSLSLFFSLKKDDLQVGTATFVHVAVSKETGKKIALPDQLLTCLGIPEPVL